MDGLFCSHATYSRVTRVALLGLSSLFLSLALSPLARAQQAEDEDVVGFDTIVNGLNSEHQQAVGATKVKTKPVAKDPFSDIWMHGGFGYATAYQGLSLPSGKQIHISPKGFQAALGIDLFSPNWMAEGTVRSFSETQDREENVSLKEFDLKLLYKNRFAKGFGYRLGGGLNARYMDLQASDGHSYSYTTPASVATLGLDMFLNRSLSLGVDVSSRNTLISDTIDRSSVDMTMRVDAHF